MGRVALATSFLGDCQRSSASKSRCSVSLYCHHERRGRPIARTSTPCRCFKRNPCIGKDYVSASTSLASFLCAVPTHVVITHNDLQKLPPLWLQPMSCLFAMAVMLLLGLQPAWFHLAAIARAPARFFFSQRPCHRRSSSCLCVVLSQRPCRDHSGSSPCVALAAATWAPARLLPFRKANAAVVRTSARMLNPCSRRSGSSPRVPLRGPSAKAARALAC